MCLYGASRQPPNHSCPSSVFLAVLGFCYLLAPLLDLFTLTDFIAHCLSIFVNIHRGSIGFACSSFLDLHQIPLKYNQFNLLPLGQNVSFMTTTDLNNLQPAEPQLNIRSTG